MHNLAKDMRPRAAWTRLVRGSALVLFDTLWSPPSVRGMFQGVCDKAVTVAGGLGQLAEDDEFYNFGEKTKTPLKGFGIMGILIVVPAIFILGRRCLSEKCWATDRGGGCHRSNAFIVLLFLIGSFVVAHVLLRSQQAGVMRLVPACFVLPAVPCAILLTRRVARVLVLGILIASTVVFTMYNLNSLGRRFTKVRENPIVKVINRLGNQHTLPINYQWSGTPPLVLVAQEDYTTREICAQFLKGIRQPAVIGFVGNVNAESSWLFGDEFCNKVILLSDVRKPGEILEPSADVDYIVFDHDWLENANWAARHGYHLIFRATTEETCILSAFKKIL